MFGMTVHCTSIKNYEGKDHFKCPNLILNYLKLLFLTSRTFIPLVRDIANHSYAPNTPLIQALNPLRHITLLEP